MCSIYVLSNQNKVVLEEMSENNSTISILWTQPGDKQTYSLGILRQHDKSRRDDLSCDPIDEEIVETEDVMEST